MSGATWLLQWRSIGPDAKINGKLLPLEDLSEKVVGF
jgi:hypothetical protein